MRRRSSPRHTQLDVVIGNRIYMARRIRNVTQVELAKALGLTFQQIQKYEKGTNCVSVGRLWDICRFLEMPLTYFFADFTEDDKEPLSSEDILFQTETMELVDNYYRINNRALARQIFDLMKTVAKSDVNKITE